MKPIFCTDVTYDKHSQDVNGEEFVFATVSEEVRKEVSLSLKETSQRVKKAQLPSALQILRFVGLCLFIGALFAMISGGVLQSNVLLFGAAGLAVYVGVTVYEKKRKKAFHEKEGADPMGTAMEIASRRVMDALEIPAHAESIDVICFRYKEEGGVRTVQPAMYSAMYVNVDVYAYTDEVNLYLADMERVFAFPLEGLRAIREKREPMLLSLWNKKAPPSAFGLTKTRRGIDTNVHYVLELTHEGEDYGIFFPVYELEALKKLTGLSETV